MLCSEAILINQDALGGHACVLHCKRWSCELCTPLNHRKIKRHAREGQPNTFLTLTCNPARHSTPDEAARALKTAWVNLRRAMERDFGVKRPPFIAIFEQTKKGWPHLHILLRCRFISQRWYSATMDRLIGAPIVDVRFIQDTGRVAAYVAKYISKAPQAFQSCKRWWRSHDYQVTKEEVETFRRYSPHVHQFTGRIHQWLWQSCALQVDFIENRQGYWRWTYRRTGDDPPPSRYLEARA